MPVYVEPVRRSSWNSEERANTLSTDLEHSDDKLFGLADYIVSNRVDEMTGKEIAELRKRLNLEKHRLGLIQTAIFELQQQIDRSLEGSL